MPGTDRLPSADVWNLVTAVSLLVLANLYGFGAWRLRRRNRRVIPRWRAFLFFAGIGATAVSLLSALDRSSDALFSAHMVQHEILMLVSAPLMVLGRPFIALLWALGSAQRRRVAHLFRRESLVALWQRLSGPFTVLVLHAVVLWGWHVPRMFELALHHEGVHVIQHLMFFGTAALFWWSLVHGRYGKVGYGIAVLYVFATALHSEVLGALLTFDSRALYATHAARTAARGLDPVADQQFAGVLMWIPFGIIFVLVGLALFAAWLGEAERRVAAYDAFAPNRDSASSNESAVNGLSR